MAKDLRITFLLDFYGDMLTEKQREVVESNRVVFEDYVLSNLSLSEIAKERDITRQGVYDIVKRCRTRLKGYEEKLHLIEKFQLTKDKLGEIESIAKENFDEQTAGQITTLAEEIYELI